MNRPTKRDHRRVIVETSYWAKPIPIRTGDWQATLDGWDLGDPIGHGGTEADAIYDLFMQIADREDEHEEQHEERSVCKDDVLEAQRDRHERRSDFEAEMD